MKEQTKSFHWNNSIMSPLQHGNQTAHTQTTMFTKYRGTELENDVFDWAESPTTIIYKGGNFNDMESLWKIIDRPENMFPYARFVEDMATFTGQMTNIGIILPERLYNAAAEIRGGILTLEQAEYNGSAYELMLIQLLVHSQLARDN